MPFLLASCTARALAERPACRPACTPSRPPGTAPSPRWDVQAPPSRTARRRPSPPRIAPETRAMWPARTGPRPPAAHRAASSPGSCDTPPPPGRTVGHAAACARSSTSPAANSLPPAPRRPRSKKAALARSHQNQQESPHQHCRPALPPNRSCSGPATLALSLFRASSSALLLMMMMPLVPRILCLSRTVHLLRASPPVIS